MLEPLAAWYAEPHVQLWQGDCRAVMAQMPAGSVDCVVFSPPFLGLRVYDGAQELIWGDKDGCEHQWQETNHRDTRGLAGSTLVGTPPGPERRQNYSHSTCSLCGAWRGAWGLEPEVSLWVAHTLEVMQAVRRVLKPSGVCFLEVGDSYASGKGSCFNPGSGDDSLEGHALLKNQGAYPLNRGNKSGLEAQGLKPKDLCLVPERLALALQADGWWVRSRIVWAKPNPMPESVSDRSTKSHSTIWMLTKAESYYWDQEAVREPHTEPWRGQGQNESKTPHTWGSIEERQTWVPASREYNPSGRQLRDVWTLPTSPFGYELCQSCGQIYTAAQFGRLPERVGSHRCKCQGQDGHTDWQEAVIEDSHDGLGVMMQPAWLCPDCETIYSLAEWSGLPQGRERLCRCGAADFLSHFATFSEAIPARCILASTSEAGCCPKCGKPWERVIKHETMVIARSGRAERAGIRTMASGTMLNAPGAQTLGWAATCKCNLPQAENVPATVLDVCSGSGTTVLAAKKLGRRAVGIDLSEAYLSLSRRRLSEVPMSLKGG